MTDYCAVQAQSSGFIGSMTQFVDCRAQLLGSGAYQALASPGSTLSIVLTGFLTIFVALIGYNLLLGRGFTIRSGMIAALKVGAVFALATSWPAYRTLVYDVVTDGPTQIASDIGEPSAVPGSDGTLVQRLDAADGALVELSVLGAGVPTAVQQQGLPPPPFAGFDAFALGGSRILFLLTAIAGLAGVRVIVGLMLALGPFFVAFLMFDNTRSLFEGWVRVLSGAALATVGVTIALGLELSLMEPWLATMLARRMAGEALPSVPTELFVITSMYALIVLALLFACARLARAFRLARLVGYFGEASPSLTVPQGGPVPALATRTAVAPAERSRAAAIADVLVGQQRRERGGPASLAAHGGSLAAVSRPHSRSPIDSPSMPVGRSLARRARSRATSSGGRRDAL